MNIGMNQKEMIARGRALAERFEFHEYGESERGPRGSWRSFYGLCHHRPGYEVRLTSAYPPSLGGVDGAYEELYRHQEDILLRFGPARPSTPREVAQGMMTTFSLDYRVEGVQVAIVAPDGDILTGWRESAGEAQEDLARREDELRKRFDHLVHHLVTSPAGRRST